MDSGTYELLALAMRYLFAAIALFIVLRAWRACVADNRNQKVLRDWSPEAGAVGELLVVEDARGKLLGEKYPVPSEGVLGSSRIADVRIKRRGISGRHYYIHYRDGMLILKPLVASKLAGGAVLRDGDSLVVGELTLLMTFFDAEAAGKSQVAARDDDEEEFW